MHSWTLTMLATFFQRSAEEGNKHIMKSEYSHFQIDITYGLTL